MPKKELGPKGTLVFCVLGLAVWISLLTWNRVVYYRGTSSAKWSTTMGKVVSREHHKVKRTKKRRSGPSYWSIKYSYSVDDKAYESSRIRFGSGNDYRVAKESYPPGKEIKVHYNPQNPKQCTLLPGFHGEKYDFMFFAFIFLIFMTVFGCYKSLQSQKKTT